MTNYDVIKQASKAVQIHHTGNFPCIDHAQGVGYLEHEYPIPGKVTDPCTRCGYAAPLKRITVDYPRPVSQQWCGDCRTKGRCTFHGWQQRRSIQVRSE